MTIMLMLMVMLICTLEGFVKVETEVGKDHPELLPPVRVLELSEQISRQLVLQCSLVVDDCHADKNLDHLKLR
jgi:hypothetical protein